MPALNKITIRGKKYNKPALERMKRKQVKKLPGLLKVIENAQNTKSETAAIESIEVLWDFVGIVLPELPEKVLDDLDVSECQAILQESGFLPDEDAVEPEDEEEITLGES